MYIVISLVIDEGGIGGSPSLSSSVAPVLKSMISAHLAAVSSGPSGVAAGEPVGAGAAGAPRLRLGWRRWAGAAAGRSAAPAATRLRRSNMAVLLYDDLGIGYSRRPRLVQRGIGRRHRPERPGDHPEGRRPL